MGKILSKPREENVGEPEEGNWFGGFKVALADHFDSEAVALMLTYFEFSTRKRDEVEKSRNKGLELLSALEDRGIIGQQVGIDKLCKALERRRLITIAREAETLFSTLKNKSSQDAPDLGPAPNIDISKLKSELHNELTAQQCYEIGVIANLRPKVLQEIKDSRESVNLLIDNLLDSGQIKSSDIRFLVAALKRIQLIRVANLITNSDDLHTPGPALEPETAENVELQKVTTNIHNGKMLEFARPELGATWPLMAENASEDGAKGSTQHSGKMLEFARPELGEEMIQDWELDAIAERVYEIHWGSSITSLDSFFTRLRLDRKDYGKHLMDAKDEPVSNKIFQVLRKCQQENPRSRDHYRKYLKEINKDLSNYLVKKVNEEYASDDNASELDSFHQTDGNV